MRVLTPAEMAKCDRDTIENGYPELLLMESAASGVARTAEEIIEEKNLLACKNNKEDLNIFVLVGKGNNGGDGLAAARILTNLGYKTKLLLVSKKEELNGVNKKNFELALLNGINYKEFDKLDEQQFIREIKESDLIIDALLGTGISGELRGNIKKIISLIKKHREKNNYVLAVDIPSGISGRDGSKGGSVLKAEKTATMAAYKRGLLLYPGREYAGEINIIDIGIQTETINKNSGEINYFDKKEALKLMPERLSYGHKGTFGKAAVLGGSRGMTGAPLLTSKAALKSGLGLVYLLTAEEIEALTTSQKEEVLGIPLPSKRGVITADSLAKIVEFTEKVDLLAAGPGLSSAPAVKKVISGILKNTKTTLVLDADALNSIKSLKLLKDYPGELILTPHPGEMSRLTGKSIETINNNRLETARSFAQEYNLNLILKGAATITAAPDGRAYVNSSGCNGMATAGSGDVLTGIISALRAQGLKSFEAAALAVYIHGQAGEFAAAQKSNYALIASDIIEYLTEVWKKLS